jgi:tetratricopeptide (TPR) repeat protein
VAAMVLLSLLLPFSAPARTQQSPAAAFDEISKRAAEARDTDHLEEAAMLYKKALALRPRWVEGWWSLGTLEYDQDHYPKAAVAFEKVIALDPKHGTAHAMLGLCQFELGKDDPALKNLLAAEQLGVAKNEQLRKVALYHMGVLQLRAKRFGDAKETLVQLAKDRVNTSGLVTALGQASLLVRPQDSPALGTPGASVIERTGQAEALLAAKEFEQAKQLYTQLASEFPEYPNLHFAFGRMLLETHETEQAVEEFQLELKRDPRNVNSLLEIAAVRYQVDSQDGLKYAEEAVKLAPKLPFAHYLTGLLLLDTGENERAIKELETARQAFPRESSVYFALGNAYSRSGHKAEAAKARAEFARLNAEAEKHPGATVYGEKLRTLDKEKPQK